MSNRFMDQLNTQLRNLSTRLGQLQETLTRNMPDPSRIQWDTHLQTTRILAVSFEQLIDSVRPELRYFVAHPLTWAFPTPDTPDTPTLLFSGDISELLSETAGCKQRYQEKIDELGLTNSTPEERQSILKDQISDHNTLCDGILRICDQVIQQHNLKDPPEAFVQIRAVQNDNIEILKRMVNGEGLPVAAALAQ
jgi:hypothetical protein